MYSKAWHTEHLVMYSKVFRVMYSKVPTWVLHMGAHVEHHMGARKGCSEPSHVWGTPPSCTRSQVEHQNAFLHMGANQHPQVV